MTEMKIMRYGGPEVFRAVEGPSPSLLPGSVRIRVSAAGVNFFDVHMRTGLGVEAPRLPFAPGFEVAGVIAEVGPGVDSFRRGERVLAMCRFGGYTTEIVLPARQVRKTPRRLSDVEGASIPLSFLTAWIALMEMARVREGDRILLPGAAGGVGSAMVQVATAAGAQVVGLVGAARKKEFVRSLGASQAFTYAEFRARKGPDSRGFDAIFDGKGFRSLKENLSRLAPGGRAVAYGVSGLVSGPKRSIAHSLFQFLRMPIFTPIGLAMANRGVHGLNALKLFDNEQGSQLLIKALDWTLEGFQRGLYRPTVGKVFPLAEAGAAHAYLQSGKSMGKVMLRCL
jgi:NADPH:quinone reductase-like Zn-dependent oxidoreductase